MLLSFSTKDRMTCVSRKFEKSQTLSSFSGKSDLVGVTQVTPESNSEAELITLTTSTAYPTCASELVQN
jgi:hypothetical protein